MKADRGRSPAHRVALLAVAVTSIAACADMLGMTEYHDAIDELCGPCGQKTLPDCKKTLEQSLDNATDPEKADWLALYADLHCDTGRCVEVGLQCFYKAPGVCADAETACKRNEACCGYNFDSPAEGTRCCATTVDSPSGHCCDTCVTCAAALGLQNPDPSQLCISHREALKAVADCKDNYCKLACDTKATCDACLLTKCKAQIDACNAETAL
ncbi:MAG: hypothetical protein U0441_18370 [Polyangiaceae bacterium]